MQTYLYRRADCPCVTAAPLAVIESPLLKIVSRGFSIAHQESDLQSQLPRRHSYQKDIPYMPRYRGVQYKEVQGTRWKTVLRFDATTQLSTYPRPHFATSLVPLHRFRRRCGDAIGHQNTHFNRSAIPLMRGGRPGRLIHTGTL